MLHYFKNIAAHIVAAIIGAGTATAAGSGDNTKVTGQTIDRTGYSSGKVVIGWKAALTDTKTLSFAIEIQESSDDSSWDTAVVLQAATVAKTADSSADFYGTTELAVDLSNRKQYVRFNITPDLSASGTDTLTWAAALVKGGADELPAA